MNQVEQIKQLLYNYETAGLIESDPIKILSCLSDDVIGFGMGEQGFVSSKKSFQDIMLANIKKDTTASYELAFDNVVVHIITRSSATICATVIVKKTCEDKTTRSSFFQSLTAVLKGNRWLICALHASSQMSTEETIDAYPLAFADNTLTQLRSEMQKESFELLNRSLSGGLLGIYVKADNYPLYFANDSIIKLLGYTREEFHNKYRENVIDIIYHEDREKVWAFIETIDITENHEFRCRWQKKDGSLIWVIQYGGKSADNSGKPILLIAVTDITGMVEMQNKLKVKTELLEAQAEELTIQNEELIIQRESIQEQTRALEISEERYLIALEKTSHIIFDYDIASGNIIHFNTQKKAMEFAANISDAKDNLFTNGTIIDEYLDDFYNAFQIIQSGECQSECTVKIKLNTGKEIWNKISLTGIKDSHGKPVKAVGLIEDITDKKESEIAYKQEEQYRKAILSDAMGCYTINFTKDRIENCQIKDNRCSPSQPNEPYDEFISRITKARMNIEYRRTFLDTFSKVSAMEAFEKGVNELSLEYNILNPDGSHMWMQTIIRLVVDGATNEKKGFLYVKDIDTKKHEEIYLKLKSELDPLTNIYNKGAAQSYISEVLGTANGIQTGAFMMVDIDHFKDINDTYGHPFGDRVLMDVSKVLRSSFRKSDIVGRLGGDEFCVFCFGMVTKKQVADIAQNVCKNIGDIFKPKSGKVGITCSIGISDCNGKPKTFEDIYREADSALYTVKKEGRNGYAFFEDKKYQKAPKWIGNPEWIQNTEWLLNEMDIAVYVCDKENYNLLYINDKILELFHLTRSQCLGKKCYEVLVSRNSPCDFCSMCELKTKHSVNRLYYLQGEDKLFLMKGQLLNWNEKEAHLEIALDITSEKERYADYLNNFNPKNNL